MQRNPWVVRTFVLIATSLMALSAQASPLQITMNVGSQSNLEQVARRCWVENGVRYCGRASKAYESDYRVRNIPEAYPTGSKHWWEEMDRQNRGGRGGGRG